MWRPLDSPPNDDDNYNADDDDDDNNDDGDNDDGDNDDEDNDDDNTHLLGTLPLREYHWLKSSFVNPMPGHNVFIITILNKIIIIILIIIRRGL